MVHTQSLQLLTALAVVQGLPRVLAHGHDDSNVMEPTSGLGADLMNATSTSMNMKAPQPPQSYFSEPNHSGVLLAHIVLMTIGWFFVLPVGEQVFGKLRATSDYYHRRHAQRRTIPPRRTAPAQFPRH